MYTELQRDDEPHDQLASQDDFAQKHRLLGDAVKETKEKLETLKTATEQAEQALKDGTITQDQYDGLQREIAETEAKLKTIRCIGILPRTLHSREVSYLRVLYSYPCISPVMGFKIIVKVYENPEIQDLNDDHEQNKVDIRDLMDNISKYNDGCKGCE